MWAHKYLEPLWDRLLGGAQSQAAVWEQAERCAERQAAGGGSGEQQ